MTEGRAREAIWRDGRWWDELHDERPRAGVAELALAGAAVADGQRRARAGRRPRIDGAPSGASSRGRLPVGTPAAVEPCHTGPAADAARADFRELMEAKGHAVENARPRSDGLEAAFAAGALERTPALDGMLADLVLALEQDEGQKLGGKSAEAARFILRAIDRELDNA